MVEKLDRKDKIRRIRDGLRPRVLDIFSGCGGLSLGFLAGGFEIAGALEIDQIACRTHAANFFKSLPLKHFQAHSIARDITKVKPHELMSDLGLGADSIDVIIGGPPCQSFARIGRAKLREILDHPEAFLHDPRSQLYVAYLDYVRELQPVALLIENVPDILNYGGRNIAEEICKVLGNLGYVSAYTLLNAAYYGVPQMRERMFLLAYAEELLEEVDFPAPSHWVNLPAGYNGSRQVALKNVSLPLLSPTTSYIEPKIANSKLPPAVTAFQALNDLPKITLHLEGKLKRGARYFDELIPYPDSTEISEYAKCMRNWSGFESLAGVKDHVIRCLPRDYRIFRRMKAGDQYPEAHQLSLKILEEELAFLIASGARAEVGSDLFKKMKKDLVPPYDPGKFPNKWRKMEPDRPARTLMAHIGKDTYSHIHYDSEQARTISVREAARLQSFPDGFFFSGTMNPAFRQIGNAVPPLLSLAIAKTLRGVLQGLDDVRETSDKKVDGFGSNIIQMAL